MALVCIEMSISQFCTSILMHPCEYQAYTIFGRVNHLGIEPGTQAYSA